MINKKVENAIININLNAKNLIAKLQKNNSIIFYDINDETKKVFEMQAPFMYDAKGNKSDDIKISLEQEGDLYKLSINPSETWLNSSERAFPIVIDPPIRSVENQPENNAVIYSSYPNYNFGQTQTLDVGKYGNGFARSILDFALPAIKSSELVTDAKLSMTLIDSMDSPREIDLYALTSPYNIYNVTWNNQPNTTGRIEDFVYTTGDAGSNLTWSVTNLVRSWYNVGYNYGVMIKCKDENQPLTSFYSSEFGNLGPILYIDYTNISGIDNSWSYHTQSIGRAGTGYVNDFSGNLVFTHDDLVMTGSRMPIDLKHIYNSTDKDTNLSKYDGKYGLGWRLNYSQSIDCVTVNGVKHYEYTDDTGRVQYFYKDSSGVYRDSSGNNLELDVNLDDQNQVSSYTIKDSSGTNFDFSSNGLLTDIVDANKNKLSINYVTGKKIIGSITDGADRTSTLEYDSNNYLTSITDPSGRKTQYSYSNGRLANIIYSDGKGIKYDYDSNNNLIRAIDIDGHKIDYGYSFGKVSSISEGNTDGTKGGTIGISYFYKSTFFNDNNGRMNRYDFNNEGKVISIINNEGQGEFYKYSSISNVDKLTAQSKLQSSAQNYILNQNAENNEYWTNDNGEGSLGSNSYSSNEKYLGYRSLMIDKTNNISHQFYSEQWG